MIYVAYAFGILGLVAFLETFTLQSRLNKIEAQLSKMSGTPQNEERLSMIDAARGYIGRPVQIELKEDYEDSDILSYGNTKHGTNTILEVDDDWLLVKIVTPKTTKEKLIRVEAVKSLLEITG